MKHAFLAAEALALLIAAARPAHAAPASLSNAAYRETEAKGDAALVPLARVMPGDRVVYVLTYRNGGDRPQTGVVISNPLPPGVEYAGPRDGAPPETSVDGGRSFGALAALAVERDGAARPAGMADVTALRWVLPDPVPPGGEVRLSYRARLK